AIACSASSTLIESPGRRPNLVGDWAAACGETMIWSVGRSLPEAMASKARYMVMILVIEAGYRGLSARLAYSTSPERASTTIAVYFGSEEGTLRLGSCAWATVGTTAADKAAATIATA